MKQKALDEIAPLLAVLRANRALHEVRPTEFHLDGHDFVHFHDNPSGVVADVRLKTGRVSMRASSKEEQADLLERIDDYLETLDSRTRGRGRSMRDRGRRR